MRLTSLIAFAFLFSCQVGLAAKVEPNVKTEAPEKVDLPAWVGQEPEDKEYSYALGVSSENLDREIVLKEAWVSALYEMGVRNFPELVQVSYRGSESLKATESRADYGFFLEYIVWRGVEEVQGVGSPFIVLDENKSTYKVYRLLRWKKSLIEKARGQIKTNVRRGLPTSPEMKRSAIKKGMSTFEKIEAESAKVRNSTEFIEQILNRMECGFKSKSLHEALGWPYEPKSGYTDFKVGIFRIHVNSSGEIYKYNDPRLRFEEVYLCNQFRKVKRGSKR